MREDDPWPMEGTARQSGTVSARLPLLSFLTGEGVRSGLRRPFDFRLWLRQQVEIERSARTGFYLGVLAMMFGIVLVHGAGLRSSHIVAFATSGIFVLTGMLLRGGAFVKALALGLGFALFGIGLAQHELANTRTTIFSGDATVRIEGRVLWRDYDERGRYRYRLRLISTRKPELSRPPEVAQIYVSSEHEPIPVGGVYRGLVRMGPPSGPAYPGAYDFAFGPFFDGLGAYGFSYGAPDPPPGEQARSLSAAFWITRLRLAISDRIRAFIGGAEGAVAAALVTGERSGIPEEIEEMLRATGLSHILSISGFHMALVAGFAMAASRLGLVAIPGLALSLPAKKFAAVFALAISTFYLLLAGDNVATERSYIMLLIMLLAVLFDRPAITLRNVAIAAIVVLLMTPHAVMTASFQMSFAATAALVGVYGAFTQRRERRKGDAGYRPKSGWRLIAIFILGLAATSLIAGTATAPYAAYHFQRVAPYGLIANLIVMPLFSLWIMPLALLSMLAMPFGLDPPLLWLMGQGLSLVFEITGRLAPLMPDSPTGLVSGTSLILLTAALLFLSFSASGLRWIAVPLAMGGLLSTPVRAEPPELLIYEDGEEVALIDAADRLIHLDERPDDFVAEQWARAYGTGEGDAEDSRLAFECVEDVCRATTRSGLRVVWTDDYEKTGLACDEGDVAIVARAIHLRECRSGAQLVTLRTLRESGSLAVRRDPETGEVQVTRSISDPPNAWNRHRFEPWPEYWKKPEETTSGSSAAAASSE